MRADWDRGVPEAVGEVAVSLRVAVQLGRLAGLDWKRCYWLLIRCVSLVAVRPGRGSSC